MNLIEIGLAFIEGLALIASPCILPVLPLVLSASVEGGRRRPFGIITGFVLAFSAFALVSRQIVMALHIDLEIIKNISLVLLLLFGVMLLSTKISAKFSQLTQKVANWGGSFSFTGKEGFFSGMLIGSLIGLVWTPCAGPILAAALVQIIRQETDSESVVMVVSFALGAAVPMLIIALAGRKLMDRLNFMKTHAEVIRKIFGVIIIGAVLFIAAGGNAELQFSSSKQPPAETVTGLAHALPAPYPAPEFAGIEKWINSSPLTMQELKGKVVLIDFWTYSCINCIRTLPYITEWDKKYRDKGLVIIGVHAPEFEFEKKPENVQKAVARYGIMYPVALDNKLGTWQNFNNKYWPAHYLIDKNGRVVYTHFGEGDYDVTENNIRYLLGEQGKAVTAPDNEPRRVNQTPETYLGYARMESFRSKEPVIRDAVGEYSFPKFLPADAWALRGQWKMDKEKITSAAPGAGLQLNFTARKVFLVLGTETGKPINVTLSLNGEVVGGKITVDSHRLYELIDQKNAVNSLLEITADAPGLEAYAFTFGG
jgi:cytochrome c biogenesis protein CcdA/thiol-disulfide isomerase/thioredoxin